jgi:hypothetical protein
MEVLANLPIERVLKSRGEWHNSGRRLKPKRRIRALLGKIFEAIAMDIAFGLHHCLDGKRHR